MTKPDASFPYRNFFRGKIIGSADFERTPRSEIFDRFGRIHDVENLTTIGLTLRQALGYRIQKQIERSRKKRPSKNELLACRTSGDVSHLRETWIKAHVGNAGFVKTKNLLNSDDKFCVSQIERDEDFYLKAVGELSERQKALQICRKQVFDVSELIFRERRRMKKLLQHLIVHGAEIIDGYTTKTWPSKFVRPLIQHLRKTERESGSDSGLTADERLTNQLFPHRAEGGIATVGVNGKGLRICDENRFFVDHRLRTYSDYWTGCCTAHDVYDNSVDTAVQAAMEIEAIVHAVTRYKSQKWAIDLDGLFNRTNIDREEERLVAENFHFLMTCRLYMDGETEIFMRNNLF